MTRPVLAIDQGTSSTKAIVVCPERGVLAAASAPVRPMSSADGSVEVDPAELLTSVLDAGRRAVAQAGEPISAVGLANQGETVLAWEPTTGRPLTTAISWQDRRAQSICDELADRAESLRRISGLPLHPYFAAPKMAWIRRHLTQDGVVTTSDSWLVHRLTGEFLTDAATAGRTALLDLDAVWWSTEAVAAFGLDGEQLPRIVDTMGLVAHTPAFGPPVPLTALLPDQQAALLAADVTEPGPAKCTYGTGAFLLAHTGSTARRPLTELAACVAWRFRGRTSYCLDGQALAAGSAVQRLVERGVIAGAADLDRVGAADTDAGQAVRAPCDSVAAQIAAVAEDVGAELGRPLNRLHADGGLSRSALLMQAQADLVQIPVAVSAYSDGTVLGMAAATRLGLDPSLELADVVPQWRAAAVYEPRITADEARSRRSAAGR
jgi:glycerol kinase